MKGEWSNEDAEYAMAWHECLHELYELYAPLCLNWDELKREGIQDSNWRRKSSQFMQEGINKISTATELPSCPKKVQKKNQGEKVSESDTICHMSPLLPICERQAMSCKSGFRLCTVLK